MYIYKSHFQQIRQKATNQTLNINFHNAYISFLYYLKCKLYVKIYLAP